MSDKTPRFGFSFFGGSVAGALTDDGSAFTMRDRLALDHILEALEGHQHSNPAGGQRVPDPTGIPAATLLTGGTLGAGQTLYYAVTFVDRHGLETASSDEIAIETATIVATPASPDAVTATGGTLTPGLYYYAVPETIDGGPLPTIEEWTKERAAKQGREKEGPRRSTLIGLDGNPI